MIFINKWDIHFNYFIFVQFYYIVKKKENEIELYCRLKGIRLENMKEIKQGFFHKSYKYFLMIFKLHKCIEVIKDVFLHFHPSMRRSDLGYIHLNINVKFYLQNQTYIFLMMKIYEHTQMILLTSIQYDQYIQQIMQISTMWNRSIDLNLIYIALDHLIIVKKM
ncbi:hypothetical protein RFI_30250 [Reticulomyxa filosa]|uniref:Uncharacterized protein n=1 Tax=Reticulomyxa filosa TaxID=46433 RepID=X6M145_RETFI|nr:hypothetical protein RFI_30250 [Reticulomyxa filosa]|eukprot:ETO07142.1 hypothetical protein RFI_30250 [Reticulomyxa filosa]